MVYVFGDPPPDIFVKGIVCVCVCGVALVLVSLYLAIFKTLLSRSSHAQNGALFCHFERFFFSLGSWYFSGLKSGPDRPSVASSLGYNWEGGGKVQILVKINKKNGLLIIMVDLFYLAILQYLEIVKKNP